MIRRLYNWYRLRTRGWYEDGDNIVSRDHGVYPKQVPYSPGMTLYPGQGTQIEIPLRYLGTSPGRIEPRP